MKKPSSDYFTLRPVRGSSPTSSLAADLSQNFHIDKRLAEAPTRLMVITDTHLVLNCRLLVDLSLPRIFSAHWMDEVSMVAWALADDVFT